MYHSLYPNEFYSITSIEDGEWKFKCCGEVLPWSDPENQPDHKVVCTKCFDVVAAYDSKTAKLIKRNGKILSFLEATALKDPDIAVHLTKIASVRGGQVLLESTYTREDRAYGEITMEEVLEYIEKDTHGNIQHMDGKTWVISETGNKKKGVNDYLDKLFSISSPPPIAERPLYIDQSMVDILTKDGRMAEFLNLITMRVMNMASITYQAFSYFIRDIKTTGDGSWGQMRRNVLDGKFDLKT